MPIQTAIDSISQNQGSPFGFKNRIMNGAMVIDQRNAGASVTGNNFIVDRWAYLVSQSSKLTGQQNAGSVTPPPGYTNYIGLTSSSAYSVISTDYFPLVQKIEGYNIADLDWGKSTAKTVTLSFWVRSSLTGTFGGALSNSAQNRSYPYTYTISSANTWEQKTITIPGDTTGTWLTNNGIGINLWISLAAGSVNSGTAGAWAAENYTSSTGATSVVGTNGATFYITGVQLEKGSTSTSFDHRPYTTELQLAQRYAVAFNGADSNSANRMGFGIATSATKAYCLINHPVTMRAKASLTNTATINVSDASIGTATTSLAVQSVVSDTNHTGIDITVASGLTSFRSYWLEFNGTSGVFILSAEL